MKFKTASFSLGQMLTDREKPSRGIAANNSQSISLGGLCKAARLPFFLIAYLGGLYFLLFLFLPARYSPTTKLDFMQDYVSARAIKEGKDPYRPISELTEKYGIRLSFPDHPTPHPPAHLVALVPLALLDYPKALFVWFVVSLLALAFSLKLLLGLRNSHLLIAIPLAVLWYPVHSDLGLGQVMSLLLLLITLCWYYLRLNRDIGGLFLGIAISFKLIVWPLLILLLLRKRFKAAIVAVVSMIACNILAAAVIGPKTVVHYYTSIGPSVGKVYVADALNFSLATLGHRLFSGTQGVAIHVTTEPLVLLPSLAPIVSSVLLITVLLVGVDLIARRHDFEWSFAACAALSLIVAPMAWWYYSILLILPLCLLIKGGTRLSLLPILLFPYVPNLVINTAGRGLTFWQGLLLSAPILSSFVTFALAIRRPERSEPIKSQ